MPELRQSKEPIYGIDLGTTYTAIAQIDQYNKPEVITNLDGDRTTPSVVYFENAENRVVGKAAKDVAELYPNQVVSMVKRYMGKAEWSFEYEGKSFRPEQISAHILRKVVNDAQNQLGGIEIRNVIITCPAYFGVPERTATRVAGKLAGLNVIQVLDEPVAAALAYAASQPKQETQKNILVFDLGGGTFDVTLLQMGQSGDRVLAKGGNRRLGGRDWDGKLVAYLAEEWMAHTGSTADPRDSTHTLQELWGRAETAKKRLTTSEQTEVAVVHNGERHIVKISRELFEELTADLLESTIAEIKHTLEIAAKTIPDDVQFDEILMVGGSTHMPQIARRLQEEYGMVPKSYRPDEAVAIGAALYSTLTEEEDFTIVTGQSFGIVVWDKQTNKDYVHNLILRNSPLPAQVQQTFATAHPGQRNVSIRVMENELIDEKLQLDQCQEIGSAILGLPANLPEGSPIEVTAGLNKEGLLEITAREVSTNQEIDVVIQTKCFITNQEIDDWFAENQAITVH